MVRSRSPPWRVATFSFQGGPTCIHIQGDIHHILGKRVNVTVQEEKKRHVKKKDKIGPRTKVSQTELDNIFAKDESRWIYKQHLVLISQRALTHYSTLYYRCKNLSDHVISSVTHSSTSFCKSTLPERLAILSTLVGYQPNNNQSNYRDTSKDTKTNWKYGQFLAWELEGGSRCR